MPPLEARDHKVVDSLGRAPPLESKTDGIVSPPT